MRPAILLERGTLWESVVKTTVRALAKGAVFPIPTGYEFIEDKGVGFFVRILSSLARKDEDKKKQAEEGGRPKNPFLPYEQDLFVADISESHVAILNKFNVLEHHLLIITREFEDQDELLTRADFGALAVCMSEYEGLGFYNGGREAGASQSHKHLQMVPLPLAPEGPRIPIEPLLKAGRYKGGIASVPGLPFSHAFARFDKDISPGGPEGTEMIFGLYSGMLRHLGLRAPGDDESERQSAPYCLLVTREWMLLVPRSREFFEGISVNSLGYAGALLVRNVEQMDILKRRGPMTALKEVGL